MKKTVRIIFIAFICLMLPSVDLKLDYNAIEHVRNGDIIADYNELYDIDVDRGSTLARSSTDLAQKIKYLAVFIEFADSEYTVKNHLDDAGSVQNAEALFNSSTPIEMNTVTGKVAVPSFKKYYEMQSYGKLEIETEIFPKENGKVVSYRDAHPRSYYIRYSESNKDGYKSNEESLKRETELINNAIAYIEKSVIEAGIQAEELDTTRDGIVDAISFFIEGVDVLESDIGWGDLLWSHKLDNMNLTSTILGKRVQAYNLLYTYDYTQTAGLFSLDRGTYGTIIHEFGHTLGYMDLYRFDGSTSRPVGFYDVMGNTIGSNPQDLLSYFITEYSPSTAWHSPLPVIKNTTRSITLYKPEYVDANEKRAVKVQTDSSNKEFFIIEYHEKKNTYNTYSADESGIIIYRVNDNNKYAGNQDGGLNGERDHVFVFRPGETGLGKGEGELSKATLTMNRRTFGKDLNAAKDGFDNETIYYADGSNSGLVVTVTGQTATSVTFDITFPSFNGSGTKEDPYILDNESSFLNMFKLSTKGKYYKITKDLDFTGINYPALEFEGNLDGGGYTLKNITSSTGVFQSIGVYGTRTLIENINVQNVNVSSQSGSYLGGFASNASNVEVKNVHLLSGNVTNVDSLMGSSTDSTGGFIGNASSDTVIDNCSSMVDVSSPKNVGGFIGINMNATIKDSFSQGTITGNSGVGGFIALQYITDDFYNVPSGAYYESSHGLSPIGGIYKGFNNQSTLTEEELVKGIIGVEVVKNIRLEKNGSIEFRPTVTPVAALEYRVTFERNDIANFENETLVGLNLGRTKVYTRIPVGSGAMMLSSALTVVDDLSKDVTEEEVLEYFGLEKKENYIVGFDLGSRAQDVKDALASFEGVTLIDFKTSSGMEATSEIIATGMTFTLHIGGTDYHYTVVIKGDVDGDGMIYATDYVRIKNHIMGKSSLQGASFFAADIDNDANIYATDYVKIRNYIMNGGTILQN